MNDLLKDWTVPARPPLLRRPGAAVTRLQLLDKITVEHSIPLFHAIRAARDNTIDIAIDSGGGNALCALALYELLIEHPHLVIASIAGRASSGAATVAMGADLRRIAPDARFMLHETRASAADATVEALRSLLADLAKVDGMSVAIFAAATGQTPEQVAEWKREEATFDAPGAIAVGLAHSIIPRADLPMTTTTERTDQVVDASPDKRDRATLMPSPEPSPEDTAWMRDGRKLADLAERFPGLFAGPMSGAHAMMIVDKLDEIIGLLKRAEIERCGR